MHQDDLEKSTQRGLSRLPSPKAPPSLLPRVMSAARAASERPWYARRWLTWPVGWQVASAAGLGSIALAAGMWLSTLGDDLVARAVAGIRTTVPAGPFLIELVRSASRDALIGSWSLMDLTYVVLIPLFLTMLAVSTVFAAALCRVARGGAFQ